MVLTGLKALATLRSMFERFTNRARHVVVLSQEEARLLNHNYIGTEHILLGLIREGEGVAVQILREHADPAEIRAAVLEAVSAGPGDAGDRLFGEI